MTREEEIKFIIGVREGAIPFEQLLEQYNPFIWKYVNEYNIAGLEYQDIYSILSNELYIASLNYDETKNIRFMSYLGTCFVNKLSIEISHSKRKKHGAEEYNRAGRLDRLYPLKWGSQKVTYRDVLLTGQYTKEQLDINYFYDCLYEILEAEGGDFEEFIVDILINEKTFKEVGEKHGITGAGVRDRYKRYIEQLKRKLIKKGITSVYMK